jgi:hypothetical protein
MLGGVWPGPVQAPEGQAHTGSTTGPNSTRPFPFLSLHVKSVALADGDYAAPFRDLKAPHFAGSVARRGGVHSWS